MKKLLHLVLVVCFMIPVHTSGMEINVVTSEFAPFNYVEDGQPKGFCTEIVQAVLDRMGLHPEIRTYPWSRAYQLALKQENTLIYTIARTPERESLFQWAGVIISGRTYLFSLKHSRIDVNSLNAAKDYRIGVVRHGIRSKHLISKGFENLDLVKDSQTNALKLINKRIDFWAEDELSTYYIIRKMGKNPNDVLHPAVELDLKLDGYVAFSRETEKETVDLFRKILNELIENGSYAQIKSKYL